MSCHLLQARWSSKGGICVPKSAQYLRAVRRFAVYIGLALWPAFVRGQESQREVRGVVRDSAGAPVAGAEVFLLPGGRSARTDDAGRFRIGQLKADTFYATVRFIGFRPAHAAVDLAQRDAQLTISMTRLPTILDTIRVTGQANCARFALSGFDCRRHTHDGFFLDSTEIAAMHAHYRGELFLGADGFRVEYRAAPGRREPIPVPVSTRGWRCFIPLVNGHPVSKPGNTIPDSVRDIAAMEVYRDDEQVPEEYKIFAWQPPTNATISGKGTSPSAPALRPSTPCALVVYWTRDARRK